MHGKGRRRGASWRSQGSGDGPAQRLTWADAPLNARPPSPSRPRPRPQLFGVDLAKLINEDGKEFVFNEFGMGGGASVTGDQPARTVAQCADGPFFGVYGPYTRKLDPWRLFLPCERPACARD